MFLFKSLTRKRIQKTEIQNPKIYGNKYKKYCYIGSATSEIQTIMETKIMKMKLALSTLLGVAAWSLSSMAMASWVPGPCPSGGTVPCIEVVENGNTYHLNGTGGGAGTWWGLPSTNADFEFYGTNVDLSCPGTDLDCNLRLSGKVKKCQDSSGAWRIGVQVNSANVIAGQFLCNLVSVGGFPWYSKDPSIANHCPFEDDCDSFIPYNPSVSTYTGHFGTINVSAIVSLVNNEHVHDVVFTPGVGASFDFTNKTFFDCDENGGCSIDGILTLDNATSLDIH